MVIEIENVLGSPSLTTASVDTNANNKEILSQALEANNSTTVIPDNDRAVAAVQSSLLDDSVFKEGSMIKTAGETASFSAMVENLVAMTEEGAADRVRYLVEIGTDTFLKVQANIKSDNALCLLKYEA